MQEEALSALPVQAEAVHLKSALKEKPSAERTSRSVRVHWDVERKESHQTPEYTDEESPIDAEPSMQDVRQGLGEKVVANDVLAELSRSENRSEQSNKNETVEIATQTSGEDAVGFRAEKPDLPDTQASRKANGIALEEEQNRETGPERSSGTQNVQAGMKSSAKETVKDSARRKRPSPQGIVIENVGRARVMKVRR